MLGMFVSKAKTKLRCGDSNSRTYDDRCKILATCVLSQQGTHSLDVAIKIFRAAERDEDREHMARGRSDHGAFGITRGAAVRSELIGKERQTFKVQIIFSDSFVSLSFMARTKYDASLDVRQIV